MPAEESVSQWIEQLKGGSDDAAHRLWQRYYRRLVGLAHQKLGSASRRVADEEDIVTEAFACFCRAAQSGRFPDLRDRDDLWHVVVRITERKTVDQLRVEGRKKRGAYKVLGESALFGPDGSSATAAGMARVRDPEPTPETAATTAEAVARLLGELQNDELRQIALLKLEGFSNEEIGEKIGRSLATVERRLKIIRKIWTPD